MLSTNPKKGEIITFSIIRAALLRASRRYQLKNVALVPRVTTFGRIAYKKKWVFVRAA